MTAEMKNLTVCVNQFDTSLHNLIYAMNAYRGEYLDMRDGWEERENELVSAIKSICNCSDGSYSFTYDAINCLLNHGFLDP